MALYMSVMTTARSTPSTMQERARSSGRTTSATRSGGEPAVASGRLYVATINADTFLHCIGGAGSSHHSSSSKDDKGEGRIGLRYICDLVLCPHRPRRRGLRRADHWKAVSRGTRLPPAGHAAARCLRSAPVDDGTHAAPFVELQESMIDDKRAGAVISQDPPPCTFSNRYTSQTGLDRPRSRKAPASVPARERHAQVHRRFHGNALDAVAARERAPSRRRTRQIRSADFEPPPPLSPCVARSMSSMR